MSKSGGSVIFLDEFAGANKLAEHLGFLGFDLLEPGSGSILSAIEENKVHGLVLTEDDDKLIGEILSARSDMPILLYRSERDTAQLTRDYGCRVYCAGESPSYDVLKPFLADVSHYHSSRDYVKATGEKLQFQSLFGNSAGMRVVKDFIGRVAKTDATVLILGDTGTGKEMVAKNLHLHSTRAEKPFVAVNCGAIPGELLESELFGHEKGAFTGAISARQGRFELAQGGTLFLDEIGDMPLMMQVKLLRVLQERTYERVGSNKSIDVDVRIIAATHRNLESAIEEGKFREDLYYRLNVFPIETPSLVERLDDLPLLIESLVERFCAGEDTTIRFTHSALQALMNYSWPGNVRELANLIERLSILYPGCMVDVQHLPAKYQPEQLPPEEAAVIPIRQLDDDEVVVSEEPILHSLPTEGVDLKEYLAEVEKSLIISSLDKTNNVVAKAARLLQMRRTTLVEKMRKYDINR